MINEDLTKEPLRRPIELPPSAEAVDMPLKQPTAQPRGINARYWPLIVLAPLLIIGLGVKYLSDPNLFGSKPAISPVLPNLQAVEVKSTPKPSIPGPTVHPPKHISVASFNDDLAQGIVSTIAQTSAPDVAVSTDYFTEKKSINHSTTDTYINNTKTLAPGAASSQKYPAKDSVTVIPASPEAASAAMPPVVLTGAAPIDANVTNDFINTILKLRDEKTGLPPSHLGHPGYKHLTFVYDISVGVMLLKATGHQVEAEHILDYFAKCMSTPPAEIKKRVDTNNVLGILKVMTPDAKTIGLVNAIDIQNPQDIGRGQLEFVTTPGPMSFMIMAFLQVNKDKYLPQAIQLGKAILLMQHDNGGIYDGDRSPDKVHTEPHLDAANALLQLYNATGDKTWKTAYDKAIVWFKKNVYQPQTGEIYQGMWNDQPHTIFATDAYSWTMSGVMGDIFSPAELQKLTDKMLKTALSRVTLELPDGKTQTMIMSDFTDSRDPDVIRMRVGFHPMGSPEWSGGVILALQKNAVRLWNKGYSDKAKLYKAMAEYLTADALKSAYTANKMLMFPYATGQGIAVGHGWKTPYFYVKKERGSPVVGGSLVGGWPILPMHGFNPFILNDNYFNTYETIPVGANDEKNALKYLARAVTPHQYTETPVTELIDGRTQIVEPSFFNHSAWVAFGNHKYKQAIYWATKVVRNPVWVALAHKEEKMKMKKIGGLVDYPWGETYKDNKNIAHYEIWKYPLLNEVATAMWILASSNYELGRTARAEYWVKRIVKELPLHQIAHVVKDPSPRKLDLVDGYWNALISWTYNPGESPRDQAIEQLIFKMGLEMNVPRTVDVNSTGYDKAFLHRSS
jgi:hypothetical protein